MYNPRRLDDQEDKFRAFIENTNDMIVVIDRNLMNVYASPSVKKILGYSHEEYIGIKAGEFIHPDDKKMISEVQASIAEKTYETVQCPPHRVRCKSGEYIWMETTLTNLLGVPGIDGYVVNARDVTFKHDAEKLISEQQERFRAILENSSDIVLVLDENLHYSYISTSMERIFGFDLEFFKGKTPAVIVHPDDFEIVRECFQRIKNKPGTSELIPEYRARNSANEYRVMEAIISNKLNVPGINGFVVNARDITQRKETEKIIHADRQILENLIDTAQLIILQLDPEGNIVTFNKYMEEISGYSRDEVIGKSWVDLFVPETVREEIRRVFKSAINDIQTKGNTNEIVTKSGALKNIEWYDKTLKDQHGNVKGLLSIGQDLTDKLRADEALRESEAKYRNLIENIQEGIWVVDENDSTVYVNPSICSMLGCDEMELMERKLWDYASPESSVSVARLRSWHDRRTTQTAEITFRSLNHDEFIALVRIAPVFDDENVFIENIKTVVDITQEKLALSKLQRELEINESLATIAQEVNDPDNSIKEISAIVLKHAQKLTGSEYGFASEIDRFTGDSVPQVFSEKVESECKIHENLKSIRFKKGDGDSYPSLWGYSLNLKETVFTNEPPNHEESKGVPEGHVSLRNFLSSPALIGGKLVGQIALANSSDGFTQADAEILERISRLYALAAQRESYELELREERDKFENYINIAAVMLIALDPDGQIQMINRKGAQMLGYEKAEDIIGLNWFDNFISECDRENIRTVAAEVFKGNMIPFEHHENAILTSDGKEKTFAWNNSVLRDESGKIITTLSSGEDVTEKRKKEEIIKIQRDLALELAKVSGIKETLRVSLAAAIRATNLDCGGIYLLNKDSGNLELLVHENLSVTFTEHVSTFTFGTPQFDLVMQGIPKYTNYTDLNFPVDDYRLNEGLKWIAVIPIAYAGKVIACMNVASNSTVGIDDFSKLILETISGQVAVAVMRAIAEDELNKHRENLEVLVKERTRELEEAQEELVVKERLSTLGHLVAVVSHEIRNPLGTIASSVYNINQRLKDPDAFVKKSLDRIERNVTRCDRIIEELLSYTIRRPDEMIEMNMDDWIGEVISDIQVPENISLTKSLDADLNVKIDTERCRRAVLNIVTNAIQALEEDNRTHEKTIRISTRKMNHRLEMVVQDNGPGILEEDREKIFDPLFSTKSFGVGLGLSIVKQIMEQHNGGIEIDSKPGEGTTVILWCPLPD